MRKAHKIQAENFLKLLSQAHGEISNYMEAGRYDIAAGLLEQCQDGAAQLGTFIGNVEKEVLTAIPLLAEYQELAGKFAGQAGSGTGINADKVYVQLQEALELVKENVRHDIKVRLEIAFLPYKASMWDSLESVWMAAQEDPDCDAYVVPIPFYDRNADGTLGAYHYEGQDFPDEVPVIHYDSYHLDKRQPDVIYIHNPYDHGNYVTSVDPRYYSHELKKYTERLIYIPYYSTSGGMSEGQAWCPAYEHVDYIVVQAEKYCNFFHPSIPREKLLPLGSPKFDRVIRLCKNPPEVPEAWKERMEGKKVYFYNTSIGGMLANTKNFLLKMEYVFQCFRGREDACLLWRPHPLLESTFDSMRKDFRPMYDQLKQQFLREGLGIYDDTPDIEKTIALCDAYIGDDGTSVTSMFGIAGKPLFVLKNNINTLPEADDWRGEIIKGFFPDGQDEWIITQGNKLYHSPENNYQYEYNCDLSEYVSGEYYQQAFEIDGKVYVCPLYAQEILVVSDHKVIKRITLERHGERPGAFYQSQRIGNYLFLIPNHYPAIVRYDVKRDKVDYIKDHHNVYAVDMQGERKIGGGCVWMNYLLVASPVDNHVVAVESESMKVDLLTTGGTKTGGCFSMSPYADGVCMVSCTGTTVTLWNPLTGAVKEYAQMPKGFLCTHRLTGYPSWERPFSRAAVYKKQIVLSPSFGNMFVSIDMETGVTEPWEPPFEILWEEKNGYFVTSNEGVFLRRTDTLGDGTFRFFDGIQRRLYDINLITKEFREIEIEYKKSELQQHTPGFDKYSEWLQYACGESSLYSLTDFLDGIEIGEAFDQKRQIEAYEEIAANCDGTCGEKIYAFSRGFSPEN